MTWQTSERILLATDWNSAHAEPTFAAVPSDGAAVSAAFGSGLFWVGRSGSMGRPSGDGVPPRCR